MSKKTKLKMHTLRLPPDLFPRLSRAHPHTTVSETVRRILTAYLTAHEKLYKPNDTLDVTEEIDL